MKVDFFTPLDPHIFYYAPFQLNSVSLYTEEEDIKILNRCIKEDEYHAVCQSQSVCIG